ncbi:MAG: metalloprotease family protein [Paludibacteraceae bacterium]
MTYEELIENPRYEKLDSFSHENIKHVVMKEMGERGRWASISNMYQLAGLMAIMIGGVKAFIPFLKYGIWGNLVGFAIGILFSATFLIAFHEIIHALAYKILGAKKLSIGVKLRKFIFFVMADKQVLDYRQFKKVALAPAIIIALITIAGMILTYNQAMFYFFLSVFGVHSLFCGGDFGLLSYFENRKDREILTFDVKEEGKTYFYKKILLSDKNR